MDEENVISEPVENFPQYEINDPSGRGEKKPPRNPSGPEAFLVITVLGILPDVIDFFSIGGLSFLSSALSWPITEIYFAQKNLKVPNVKKWFRWLNIGDAVPFLGVIPLKTVGLIIAVWMAWHPESKITKGVQALDAAASAKAAAGQTAKTAAKESSAQAKKGGVVQRIKDVTQEYFGGTGDDEGGDIYGEISEGGQQILGPKEQADRAAFGEVISAPPEEQEEEEATSLPEPRVSIQSKPKLPTEIAGEPPASMSSKEKERQEEIESRLGIGKIEREIVGKLSSPEAVMEDAQVLASDNENVVDLSGYRKNKKGNSSGSFPSEGDNSQKIVA